MKEGGTPAEKEEQGLPALAPPLPLLGVCPSSES